MKPEADMKEVRSQKPEARMKSLFRPLSFVLLLCVICGICGSAFAVTAPVIFTTSLPAGQNAVAYSATVKAKFGTKPYSFTIVSGGLPTGLSIATVNNAGVISGTPTVNNTFSFVIRLTDSQGSPKTYDRSFYIIVTGTAPAPTPAVQITTTTPLSPGIVGSFYTTTLQAINGSTPYTWSVSAGAVPAGTTLNSSTGVLSGTPTAPGIVSFSAKVVDSSATASTATQSYMVSVTNPTPAPTYLFTDGFENGCGAASCTVTTSPSPYLPAWDAVAIGNATAPPVVQNTIKHSGSYALQFHYVICGDSTNPACGAAHQDLNRYVVKILAGQTHVFISGWVYYKTPETGLLKIIQRKIMWESDSTSAGASSGAVGITPLLGGYSGGNGVPTANTHLTLGGNNNPSCSLTVSAIYDLATLSYDTWHRVQEEIQLNTPGVSDGIYRLWIDGAAQGSPTYQNLAYNFQGTCNVSLSYFSFGRQADRSNYDAVDEYRYWDDITVGTSFIP